MSKTAKLNLRVEPELKKDLEQIAKKDKRSVNTLCEIMLETQVALKKQKSGGN